VRRGGTLRGGGEGGGGDPCSTPSRSAVGGISADAFRIFFGVCSFDLFIYLGVGFVYGLFCQLLAVRALRPGGWFGRVSVR
jgi:hypothetical protein